MRSPDIRHHCHEEKEAENIVERLRSNLQIFNEIGECARIVSSMIELGNALLLQGSRQDAKFYFFETIKMAMDELGVLILNKTIEDITNEVLKSS